MSYSILGQNLHETADYSKVYFSQHYGATHFKREEALDKDLSLKPTWQATMAAGYRLCVEVRESPFSNSLFQFVTQCATRGMPVRLWVAVPHGLAAPTFNSELRQAREAGVGVVQFNEDGTAHEFHRPVPLSVFALKKTDLKVVPPTRREEIKTAESTFLDGTPDQGCQSICQALESITRSFGEFTHSEGWWRQASVGSKGINFQTTPWARVLEEMEKRIDVGKVKSRSPSFSKQAVVKVRGHTDWRNAVSHKPKTLKELQQRDARLRTMFESTRDILIEWYTICKSLKLI